MPRRREDFSFLARFGSTLLKAGVATVPASLYYYQAELGLKPEEVWFISTILSYRWTRDLPYPSLAKITQRTGVGRTSLRRYRSALENASWQGQPLLEVVERTRNNGGQTSNGYDFSGLFAALEALITRDRHLWFHDAPLIGDPLSAEDEGEAVDHPDRAVDNGVDNPVPLTSPGQGSIVRKGQGPLAAGGHQGLASSGQGAVTSGRQGPWPEEASHEVEPSEPDPELHQSEPGAVPTVVEQPPQRGLSRAAISKASASTEGANSAATLETNAKEPRDSQWIDEVVAEYTLDLHDDPANGQRNQTQALRIWFDSGFTEAKFVDRLGKAKRRASAAKVTKQSVDGSGLPNRMPYFFKVLRDITGVD